MTWFAARNVHNRGFRSNLWLVGQAARGAGFRRGRSDRICRYRISLSRQQVSRSRPDGSMIIEREAAESRIVKIAEATAEGAIVRNPHGLLAGRSKDMSRRATHAT